MIPPISHISYSALTLYLRDRYTFKKIYIDKIYEDRDRPASVVGKAFHKCLECYYKGVELEDSLEIGRELIHNAEPNIDFGKTGSLEKCVQDYTQTVEHYLAESPFPRECVIASEEVMDEKIRGFKVSIKAVSDLLIKEPTGDHAIVDFKKVTALTDQTDLHAAYIIQAAFNYWTVCSRFKFKPACMYFREVKTSKNKDGSPQTNTIVINFDDPQIKIQILKVRKLVNDVVRELSRKNCLWLPNVNDMMSGQEAWLDYIAAV